MFNYENDRRGGNEVTLWAPPPIIGIVIRNRSRGLPEPQCVHLMSDPAAGQLKHRELEETPPINWHKRLSSWIQTNPDTTWHTMYLIWKPNFHVILWCVVGKIWMMFIQSFIILRQWEPAMITLWVIQTGSSCIQPNSSNYSLSSHSNLSCKLQTEVGQIIIKYSYPAIKSEN